MNVMGKNPMIAQVAHKPATESSFLNDADLLVVTTRMVNMLLESVHLIIVIFVPLMILMNVIIVLMAILIKMMDYATNVPHSVPSAQILMIYALNVQQAMLWIIFIIVNHALIGRITVFSVVIM